MYVFPVNNIADESNKLPADIPFLILGWDLHSEIRPLLHFDVTIKLLPLDINLVIFALEKHIWQILNNGRRQDRTTIAFVSNIRSLLLYLSSSDSVVTVVLDSYNSSDGIYDVSKTFVSLSSSSF